MPTRKIRYAPAARRDLDEIWDFIADDNPEAADRVIDRLRDVIQKLAEWPGMGRARPELGSSYRSFPVDDIVIFYRPVGSGIEILRCAHGARRIETLF